MTSRKLFASLGSAIVIVAIVVVIALSLVPFPDFASLDGGHLDGAIAFVDESNCVLAADLARATIAELHCESEHEFIDALAWSSEGIEISAYLNQPITRVIDPTTGDIIETRSGDVGAPPSVGGLIVDRDSDGDIVIYDEENEKLLTLSGPDRYWIEVALPDPASDLAAITDSLGRLAVFDRAEGEPFLVAENVRSWPQPVWRP